MARTARVRICAPITEYSLLNPSRKSTRGRRSGFRILVRLVGWSFSAAVALIVLAYVALPAMLRYGLPHALARYGVESSVESASVNLANERVTLVGFQIGQSGGPAIRWGEVTARMDMVELLKGNIRIIDFQVKDGRVDLAQLRVSEWKPPARATAIPELRKLNIEIGNVVLADLELIGLSEKIGQKVELRSLSVGSLSHLEAGERVAFQLEGVVGDATLRLAGRARMVEDLPVIEGRYELGALDLEGFGHLFGLATPGSVDGRVDGNGTFGLAYVQGEGVIRADLSGTARVSGLELDSGEARFTRTTAEWRGDARVFWPVAGGPPRFTARGDLNSPALEAARTNSAPFGILMRGLRWNGELRQGSEFAMEGRFTGELLRVDAAGDADGRLDVELSHISADAKYRWDRGGHEFEAGTLTAESAILTLARDGGRRSAAASRILLEKVRLGDGGYAVGRFEAESAKATVVGGAELTPSRVAQFIGLGASGIDVRAGGGAVIDQVETVQAKLDLDQLSIGLSNARARNIEAGKETPFEAQSFSASSLRQKTGDLETWASELRFSGAGISALGEVFSGEAAAERLSQARAGDPLWEATGVRAAGLVIGSRQIETGKLSAGQFAYGDSGSDLIEIDRGEGSDLLIQYNSRIDAGTLKLESMRFRRGGIAALEFSTAELQAPGISFQGELSAKRFDAERARYLDADANVSLIETLKLGELSGRLSTGLRIDAAHATRLVHDRAAGADYEAAGLALSRIEFSGTGSASAVAGRLETLELALADGARLTLEEVAAAHPVRTAAGSIAADGGRVRKLSYRMPGERVVNVLDIDVGAIEGDENDAHRIASVNAAGAEAFDPAAEGELRIGALQITAIRISAAEGVRAERASATSVSVQGLEGAPTASFFSARINFDRPALEPGERLRLGDVLLDEAALTMGLNDSGEFVLPGLPFLSVGRDESSGGLTIRRLETRQAARFDFFDRSASPAFEIVISPLRARLENVHTAEPAGRAKFMVDGSAGEFSKLSASGEFSFENDGLNLEVSGKVAAFELDRLNMYAAKHARRAVRSGRGDAAFDIALRGRKLSGTIHFVFSKVAFEPAPAPGSDEERSPAELSLQHSFAMLKDRDGIVRLTVPLSGSLDDPKFNFSDGLVQALMKTVRSTVMLTFKPLGLLVDASGLFGSSAGVEFKPVAFQAGDQTLTGEGLAHLDALARTLEKHPSVEVQICGRAVSADRIQFEQRLNETRAGAEQPRDRDASGPAGVDVLLARLAEARASAVRRYLEDKKQIAPKRLLQCEATVGTTPGRLPRVDLTVLVETQSTPGAASDSSR